MASDNFPEYAVIWRNDDGSIRFTSRVHTYQDADVAKKLNEPGGVLYRRPVGEWEVVPDGE